MAVLGRVDGLGRGEDLRGFQRTVYRTYWFILSEEEGSERAENLSNFLVCLEGWRCQNMEGIQERGAVSFKGKTKEIVFEK